MRSAWVVGVAVGLLLSGCSGGHATDQESSGESQQRLTAPGWQAGHAYAVNDLVSYQGNVYRCVQAHTSQAGWTPTAVPALWSLEGPDTGSNQPPGGAGPAGPLTLDFVTLQADCDQDPGACCPAGSTKVSLTNNADVKQITATNQCTLALSGSDTVTQTASGASALNLGAGDDTAMDGPGDTFIWGGLGNDTINGYGGTNLFFGGYGDDTINAANGVNTVVPGPGRDTVAMGTGDDTAYIFDECELVSGDRIDGGSGTDTLYTPISLSELTARGVTISNFERIIVQDNHCRSQCAPKTPGVGPNGLSVRLPRGLRVADVALHAAAKLDLKNGVKVLEDQGGYAPVSSSGLSATTFGTNVETGALFSFSDANVDAGSVIHGPASSEGHIVLASGARVTQAVAAPTELEPLSTASVAYTRPSTHVDGFVATSRAVAATANVDYGPTTIGDAGELKLAAGDYHFDSLTVEDTGLISIDNAAGPVRIFVHGAFSYAGVTRETLPEKANILFATTTCNDITISGPFRGTLLAPSAAITLKAVPVGHTGAFFGASVNVEAGTIVQHAPFERGDCAQVDDGCGTTFGCSATKACASPSELASITPRAECVLARKDGSFVARFGYDNSSSSAISASAGPQNKLSSGSQFQTQTFDPGHHEAAFYVKLQSSLTWTVGSKQATVTTSSPRCQNIVEGLDTPIRVTGGHDNESGASTPGSQNHAPVDFQIPKKLTVSLGGAGNGTATLTYQDTNAGQVVCTYRGGSRVATAVRDLDRARGRFYNFVSCSNGAAAGSTANGSQWTVNVVSGDPTYSQTQVTAQVGPGCSVMEAPIPADVSIQTRQGFSWKDTQPLAETDPAGLPAMYYAWIYIERREQLDALKRMKIYHRVLPIFSSQLSAYAGKCGTLDTSGDGTGIFVHALVPGVVFNLWRSISLVVLNRGNGTVPFRAVQVMPAPEPELMNSDGLSMSWAKMKASGMVPFGRGVAGQAPLFGVHIPIVDDAIEVVEDVADTTVDVISGVPVVGDVITGIAQIGDTVVDTAISIAPTFDEIVESTVDLVETVQGVITGALGEFESWIFGTVPVHLDLTVLNRDSSFNTDGPMLRGWGPTERLGNRVQTAERELELSGMRAEIHKWGNLLVPTMYENTVNDQGQVNIEVQKGGSSRGQSGLCISLENDAAMMTSGITENEFCDFRDLEWNWDFDNGTTRELRINDWQIHAFNQINDAWQYARRVIGITPRQAEVGVGWTANVISNAANKGQPLTACLNFPEGEELLLEVAGLISAVPGGAAVGAVGMAATPFIRRDMFLPDTQQPRDSRGITTHEYGHFIMCDILHDIDNNALLRLFRDRVPEGDADARDDDVTVQSEAFADFIMSQVTSGTNYSSYTGVTQSNFSSFCNTTPCFEENFRGQSEAPTLSSVFNDEARRFTSLMHDVVDHRLDTARTDNRVPTNGDNWTLAPGSTVLLTVSPTGYMRDRDDTVELPGTSVPDWWDYGLEGCRGDVGDPSEVCHIDPVEMQRGIVKSMYDNNVTWCSACSLIMSHSNLPQALSAATRQAIWHACADTPEGQRILGPPPEPSLRLRRSDCSVCPTGSISTVFGTCSACRSNETVKDNKCVVCPTGSIINDNHECVPCGAKQVSSRNKCVDCEFFQTPDRSTNRCVDCSADMTLDWKTLGNMCPSEHTLFPIFSAASDTCPDQFWVEVDNIDDALARATKSNVTFDGFDVWVSEPAAVDANTCKSAFTTVSAILGKPGDWTSIGGKQGPGVWTPESCQGAGCTPASCTTPIKVVPGSEVVNGQKNMRLLGLAQQHNFTTGQDTPAFGFLNVSAKIGRARYPQCDPK